MISPLRLTRATRRNVGPTASEQRKYEGEMAPVYRARTLLQSATQSGSDPVAHHPV